MFLYKVEIFHEADPGPPPLMVLVSFVLPALTFDAAVTKAKAHILNLNLTNPEFQSLAVIHREFIP